MPSIHVWPEAWGPWEGQYAPPILHYACIMPIPSLQLQKKTPVSCREAKRLVPQLWSPRFVTMLCSQLCYETAANPRTIVEIELLATASWTCVCQPFSCRCSQNVMHCRFVRDVCSRSLFLPFLWEMPSTHSLGEAWASWEPRTFRHLCINWWHHAHPFVAAAKKTSHMQRSRGSGRGVVVSKICYNTVIELLASVFWKWGCQPFSCRCSQNLTLPKRDFLDILV